MFSQIAYKWDTNSQFYHHEWYTGRKSDHICQIKDNSFSNDFGTGTFNDKGKQGKWSIDSNLYNITWRASLWYRFFVVWFFEDRSKWVICTPCYCHFHSPGTIDRGIGYCYLSGKKTQNKNKHMQYVRNQENS